MLYYYQPDDYWHLVPEDPASWWASEFEIIPVREVDGWKQSGINNATAYIGDSPALLESVDAQLQNAILSAARLSGFCADKVLRSI